MTQDETPPKNEEPCGRLVMIAESRLTEASRKTLRHLLEGMMAQDDVTMVSGLTRACMLQASGMADRCAKGLFYNTRDYISPDEAMALMPWREIWLVAGGRVWKLGGQA